MAANIDGSGGWDAIVQPYFDKKRLEYMINKKHPLFQMLPKMGDYRGSTYEWAVSWGLGGGGSNDISVELGTEWTTKHARFKVSTVDAHVNAYLDRRSMLQARTPQAFADAQGAEIDGRINLLTRRIMNNIVGSGSNSVGQIRAGQNTASTSVRLTAGASRSLEVGTEIQLSSADGTGSLRDSSSYIAITNIDRSTDTLTFATNLSTTISGAAAGDYVFVRGTHNAGCAGFTGFIPFTAPTSGDSFAGGNDRSQDVVRMAGHRLDATTYDRLDAIKTMCAQITEEGLEPPDIVVTSPYDFSEIEKSHGTYERYEAKSKVETGFSFLNVYHAGGSAKIIQEPFWPRGTAFVGNIQDWLLFYSGSGCPHVQDESGKLLHSTSADQFEVRMHAYFGLVCRHPVNHGVINNLS